MNFRISVLLSTLFTVVLPAAPRAHAAPSPPLLSTDEVRFVESQMVRDEARLRAQLGSFAGFITGRERVDLARVWIASAGAVTCVLQRAIDRALTSPQLFSDPLFARRGALALFVDRDVLAAIDREFDLHSVFLIQPKPREGEGPLGMSYFLIGQGVLVLRYPRAGSYDHPDPAFRVSVPLFGSSRTYEVAPLIRMDIVDGAAPGFDHVATLADPGGKLEDFVGPWNASIRSIVVRGNKLDVHAHLVFGRTETLEIPRIERRPGHALDAARLRALGCPAGGPWGQGG
jgi:hypothetical protein